MNPEVFMAITIGWLAAIFFFIMFLVTVYEEKQTKKRRKEWQDKYYTLKGKIGEIYRE